MPRGLEQVKGNLYRHTSGPGLAVHSGLVLITREGALVIDPAATCTAGWLRDEIRKRFNVSVKCVVYTHAHTDHISGGQVFQQDGAIVVANQREPSPRRVVTFRVSGPLAALVSAGLLRTAGCRQESRNGEPGSTASLQSPMTGKGSLDSVTWLS